MGKLSTALVVSSLGVVVVAYLLWKPLPDNLDQKGLVRVVSVVKKVMNCLQWIGPQFFGCKNQLELGRKVGGLLLHAEDLNSDPQLQVKNDVLDGIQVRVYRPTSAPVPSPVLLNFHGGGWSLGSIDMADSQSRHLAKHAGVTVVSVEYRLAPEHPFPAALDDCVTVTVHVLTHGLKLGLDPTKVGVTGVSAGGNLAAAVALQLLDTKFQNLPKLVYQVLINPVLQAVDLNLPSFTDSQPVSDVILSRQDMARFIAAYAGLDLSMATLEQICAGQHIREKTRSELAKYVHRDLLTEKKSSSTFDQTGGSVNETLAELAEPVVLNYLLSPLLAPDNLLKRVPRAMIVMSPNDVLRDEALLYVRRLRQVGVEVTSHSVTNGHHASMGIINPEAEAAVEAYQKVTAFIKENIST